jgi:hypothetical protein
MEGDYGCCELICPLFPAIQPLIFALGKSFPVHLLFVECFRNRIIGNKSHVEAGSGTADRMARSPVHVSERRELLLSPNPFLI